MKYKLTNGVVLFRICGEYYIFPSRQAEMLPALLICASEELARILQKEADVSEKELAPETYKKIQHLIAAGFIERY